MKDRYAETEHDFAINVNDGTLPGRLTVPTNAEAIIIFTDSSSRTSMESIQLAEAFQNQHFGTLQMDLLFDGEEEGPELYSVLSERVEAALNWLRDDADTRLCDYVLFSRTASGANSALKVMQDKTRNILAGVLHVDLVDPSELPDIPLPTLVLTSTVPDIDVKNLFMAKPGNIVKQAIDWYRKVLETQTESSEEKASEEISE